MKVCIHICLQLYLPDNAFWKSMSGPHESQAHVSQEWLSITSSYVMRFERWVGFIKSYITKVGESKRKYSIKMNYVFHIFSMEAYNWIYMNNARSYCHVMILVYLCYNTRIYLLILYFTSLHINYVIYSHYNTSINQVITY